MTTITAEDIERGYRALNRARAAENDLEIALAEAALNDLLERFNRQTLPSHLSHVTSEREARCQNTGEPTFTMPLIPGTYRRVS